MASQATGTQPRTLWVIWIALLAGILVYQFQLGGGFPRGRNADGAIGPTFIILLAAGEIMAAAVIRWLMIPRTADIRKLLVYMIIGIALSENLVFFGIFIIGPGYPQTRQAFFLVSLFSALQFAPVYARAAQSALLDDRGLR